MKKINKKTNKKEVISVSEKVIDKKPIKISNKIAIPLISFLILVALVGICFYKFGIAATVNGKPIYRWSYVKELQKSDKQAVLNQLVQEKLINDEGKNKGIVIEQQEIDESITKIEEQVKSQGTTLEEALQSEGMTKDALISQIRTQRIVEKLVNFKAEINQEQIDKFIKDNKDYLPTGKTKEELETLAKQQLETQMKNEAIGAWYENLSKSAKIVLR